MEFGPLRQHILQLAVSGQLVEQLDSEPAVEQVGPAPKTDEVPFEIPAKWKWVPLDKVCSYIQRGKAPKYSEIKQLPVVAQKCNQWDGLHMELALFIDPATIPSYKPERFLQPNDVLLNSTGTGTLGRVGLYDPSVNPYEQAVADGHVTVIRAIPNKVLPQFIKYVLTSAAFQAIILDAGKGTTNQRELALSIVKQLLIPLPPVEEQYRIIDLARVLLERLDQMEAAYSEFAGPMAERFRNLMLDKAIRGELVPQLDSEPEVEQVGSAPKPEDVPFELPPKWKWVQLTNLCSKSFSGGTPSKANNEYWGGDIPWASIKDLSSASEELLTTQDYITELGLQESSSKLVETGNVIVGMRMGLDKIAINKIKVAINQDLRALYLVPELIIPEYFVKFYKTLKLEGAGTTVKGIKANQLLATWTPLPPLEEQRRIVAKLEEVFAGVEKLGSLMEYA